MLRMLTVWQNFGAFFLDTREPYRASRFSFYYFIRAPLKKYLEISVDELGMDGK